MKEVFPPALALGFELGILLILLIGCDHAISAGGMGYRR